MSTRPFQQAIATTRSVLANVTPAQMGDSTPCAKWDIVGGQAFFATCMRGEQPGGDETEWSAVDQLAAFPGRRV